MTALLLTGPWIQLDSSCLPTKHKCPYYTFRDILPLSTLIYKGSWPTHNVKCPQSASKPAKDLTVAELLWSPKSLPDTQGVSIKVKIKHIFLRLNGGIDTGQVILSLKEGKILIMMRDSLKQDLNPAKPALKPNLHGSHSEHTVMSYGLLIIWLDPFLWFTCLQPAFPHRQAAFVSCLWPPMSVTCFRTSCLHLQHSEVSSCCTGLLHIA